MTRLQKLVVATLLSGYVLVLFGGIVRLSGSGMGCGTSWPFCNGALVPSTSTATLIDFAHRLLALVVTLLTLSLLSVAWRRRVEQPRLFLLAVGAATLVLVQIGIGALATLLALPPSAVTLHLGLAQLFLGVLSLLALGSFAPQIAAAVGRPLGNRWTGLGRLALAASVAVFALILTGVYTATAELTPACSEWPVCQGRIIPTGWSATDIHLTHRWLALIASIAVVAVAMQARRLRSDSPALVASATAVGTLMVVQIFVGAASIWFQLNPILGAAHLAVATIVWTGLLGVVALDRMIPLDASARPARVPVALDRLRRMGSDYVILTKPGVMVLLLITTFCGMLIAKEGLPALGIIFWTLVGGALSSGGAAAMNHYMDRDIDVIMKRTRSRPLPGKRIPPVHVPIFAVTLTVLAVYLLAVFVNPLAAALSLAGNLFYVFVYTKYLKRSTPQNIVIGGAAGAVPPMVGWAAVTGHVGLPALLLFAVVFYWTPPHFWALALFTSSDYAAAKVPMFPEVYGHEETRRHIFLYTIMLVIASLFFFPLRVMGPFYLFSALLLGGVFLYKSYVLTRHPDEQKPLAKSVFFYSMWYLALIFAAMVIDRVFFT